MTTAPSRFLPNIGWLEPATVLARITGKSNDGPKTDRWPPARTEAR